MTGLESFFEALKSKRKSQNIEISEICEFTRIHPRYIEAIENGDFTILPNVYIRLFLKSYAKFIGADPAKALKDYELHTTGKIRQSDEPLSAQENVASSSPHAIDTKIDSISHISPKQVVSGIGVIIAIFLLLWWAGQITQEQTENIKSNQPEEASAESIEDTKNNTAIPESSFSEQSSKLSINQKTPNKISGLPDKFPLNDNDFLPRKKDSEISQKVKLFPPYTIFIKTLQETKLNISKTEDTKIIELINQTVPGGQEFIFNFTSTIHFEFWRSSQVNVKLNETSIDDFLKKSDMKIRGSYEAKKSKLYLSYYKR